MQRPFIGLASKSSISTHTCLFPLLYWCSFIVDDLADALSSPLRHHLHLILIHTTFIHLLKYQVNSCSNCKNRIICNMQRCRAVWSIDTEASIQTDVFHRYQYTFGNITGASKSSSCSYIWLDLPASQIFPQPHLPDMARCLHLPQRGWKSNSKIFQEKQVRLWYIMAWGMSCRNIDGWETGTKYSPSLLKSLGNCIVRIISSPSRDLVKNNFCAYSMALASRSPDKWW